MTHIPMVIESSGRHEVAYDIFSKLQTKRTIMLMDEIEDNMASIIVAQLLLLDSEDKEEPITMYINSPGGVITAGLAIYDTMNFISAPVNTVCIGQAASMGAFLLSSGAKRYSLPNARIMIHQPSGGAGGQATDIEIQTKEIIRMKESLNSIMSSNTGQKLDKIASDMERDLFMSASEAVKYGLIDKVITSSKG